MLVFVNYTHFSKIYRNYASPFCFKLGKNASITMQRTSKLQRHLLHLHLGTFKSHNSSSENYKNSNTKPAHGRQILGKGNRTSQVCACVESCEKSPFIPPHKEGGMKDELP